MGETEAPGKPVFGELLRKHRLVAALSQEALAERAGLSVDAIRALERGRRGAPRPDTIARLVDALALDPDARSALIAATTEPATNRPLAGQGEAGDPEGRFHPQQHLPVGGFIGSLPTEPLVARDKELASLVAAIESATRGQGRTMLLAGEAGVGKTRLAQEATCEAHRRGFLLTAGRCYEEEQSVPYYPFLEAFAAAYMAAPPLIQKEAGARWPYLGVLLPNHLPAPEGVGASDEQQRVLFAATSFLVAVAEQVPLALLLDDLHWADSASLRLLLHLACHVRLSRIFILGTYRDSIVDSSHPLAAFLRDLSRDGLLERLGITGLEQPGTAALMAAVAGAGSTEQLVQLIHRRTDGNPFFVQQVMRQLVERTDGRLTPELAGEIQVPEAVRSVIGQRVRGLSESAQAVLHEASILGQSFSVDDLAAMTQHREDEVDEGLDEAERMGLVRETGTDVYGFDHALTQEALYHGLSARRRRRLHRAAGEAIARLPEGKRARRAAELAWHFLEGDKPQQAIPYALLAGDHAEAVFAHVEAERHYRTVLQLTLEAEDESILAEACEKLAAPLHRSGRYDEALAALEQAAAVYERQGDFARLLPVMAEIAGVHGNRGTPEEGMARLAPVLSRFEAMPPSPGLIYLYGSQGSLLFVLGRAAEHLAVAERAAQMAETLDDTCVLAVAKEQLGLALLSMRRRDEAHLVLEEAMALSESVGDLATLGLALNNAAYVAELRGELRKSIGLFERGLELAERLGIPAQTAFMSYALSRNHLEHGDWLRARAYAEQAVAISGEIGPSWVAPYPVLGLGRILQVLGDPQAETYLQDGLTVAEGNADLQAIDIVQGFLAELDLQQGKPERALERLHDAGVNPDWDPVAVSLPTALVLGQTLGELGRLAEARAAVEKVIDRARQAGENLVLAEALSLRALLCAEAGDRSGADSGFSEAVSLARVVTYPYAEARALSGWAQMERRAEKDLARERLEHALAIFRRLGATKDVERGEQMLAELR